MSYENLKLRALENKGYDADEIIRQCRKLDEAGIEYYDALTLFPGTQLYSMADKGLFIPAGDNGLPCGSKYTITEGIVILKQSSMTYLKAVEAGCDSIDCSLSHLSLGISQSATEVIAETIRETSRLCSIKCREECFSIWWCSQGRLEKRNSTGRCWRRSQGCAAILENRRMSRHLHVLSELRPC